MTKLHAHGTLPGLSDLVGARARTNSEQLLAVTIPYGDWKEHPNRIHTVLGSIGCTSAAWPDPSTSAEPCFYGVDSNAMACC